MSAADRKNTIPKLTTSEAASALNVAISVAKFNVADEVHISLSTAERVVELLKEKCHD